MGKLPENPSDFEQLPGSGHCEVYGSIESSSAEMATENIETMFIKLSINDSILALYGTVTGNTEICANKVAQRLKAEGFNPVIKDASDVAAQQLQDEKILLICISTYGEGDPPNMAVPLWETLVRDGQFDLARLSFSVFALERFELPKILPMWQRLRYHPHPTRSQLTGSTG